MSNIVNLSPLLIEKVWGTNKLSTVYGKQAENIGEAWLLSTLKKSMTPELTKEDFNYMVKIIDTSDHLSIQVHPQNDYAKRIENSNGKSECWYILDHVEGAGVYLGFKPGVTSKHFQEAINARESIDKYLNFFEVKKNDFFMIPAGAVHAIGKGVTILETQQSSGVTYRVWDWNRKGLDGKERDLHVDKAMDVLNFNKSFNISLGALDFPELSFEGINVKIQDGIINIKKKTCIVPLENDLRVDDRVIKKLNAAIFKQDLKETLQLSGKTLIVTNF